jgi:hypothetical protein
MANIANFPSQTAEYLPAADVARLIRVDLKAAFPLVTFSVRSSNYSMGSSVRIGWTDGPTEREVNEVVTLYRCEGFDGMTDSRTNSGPVRLDDGRLVRITSFIMTERRISEAFRARVAAWFDRNYAQADNGLQDDRLYAVCHRASVVQGCLVVRHAGVR